MKTKVDKELLPMKAHYFLFNAGTAPVVPFMQPLARQLGFSTVVVGTMYTILPIIGMLAKPLFGFIADRYQRHRTLFLASEILTALAFFLIMFIPPIPPPMIEFHCHNGVADVRYESNFDNCIKSAFESHYGNSTLTCKLNCQAEPYMWDIVCDDWLRNSTTVQPNECHANRSNPQLEFQTYMNMNHLTVENNSLFFMIEHDRATINGENVTMVCPANKTYFKAYCDMDCDDNFVRVKLSENRMIENKDAMGLYQFWLLFLLLILSWIGMAVVVSIGDAICFSILGERHHLYGNQRLFGSIGWGIFSIIAGVLVDVMSNGSPTKDYSIVFWMTAAILGFDVFASTKLKHTQTHLSPNILKDVGEMFLSVRCIIYFIWCILIGFGTALIWIFLFWYLEDLSAATEGCQNSVKTLEGFAMGIQCFGGELPFFFLSGWILKKIGHVHAMSLVLFSFGVRFILYSMLENPWYVLPIELLHGVTFGLFYATMASYASILAPPGAEATMQGLVGAIFEGVGVSTGSLIGGMLFQAVGGGHTFEIFAVGAFFAFILHVVVQKCLKYWSKDSNDSANGKNTQFNAHDSYMQKIDNTQGSNQNQAQESNGGLHKHNVTTNATNRHNHDAFTDIELN